MGLITGYKAAIDGMTCLERFKIVTRGMDNAVACSSSNGAVVRSDTNRDWFGVAAGFGYLPPVLPGATFQFMGGAQNGQGWTSQGVGGAANDTSTICDRVRIFCHPQESELLYWHLYFSGNGSLTPGAESAEAVTSLATTPPCSIDLGITIGGTPVANIGYWDLEIKGNTTDPIWPSGRGGWPSRSRGNIDAMITWRQFFDTVDELPDMLTPSDLFQTYQLFVQNSPQAKYWEIQCARLLDEPVDYVVRNKENKPEYVVVENRAGFSACDNSSPTPVMGHIITPDGVTYWPSPS